MLHSVWLRPWKSDVGFTPGAPVRSSHVSHGRVGLVWPESQAHVGWAWGFQRERRGRPVGVESDRWLAVTGGLTEPSLSGTCQLGYIQFPSSRWHGSGV